MTGEGGGCGRLAHRLRCSRDRIAGVGALSVCLSRRRVNLAIESDRGRLDASKVADVDRDDVTRRSRPPPGTRRRLNAFLVAAGPEPQGGHAEGGTHRVP